MKEFMKIWLFDILACPLDKSFPLKLYIFSFENEPEEFQLLIKTYENRDINSIKNEALIELIHEKNEIYIRDDIIIEKTILDKYLTLTSSSIIEFENMNWDYPIKGIRQKVISVGHKRLRLVEYTQDMEPHLCSKGHIGYLLEGRFEIEFDEGKVIFEKGNGVFIQSGEEHRHMGRVLTEVVRAVFIEDA